MNLNEELGVTRDFFVYTITYVDRFPTEDEMTTERAFEKLTQGIRFGIEKARRKTMRHWLPLALNEMNLARENLADIEQRDKHLKVAYEFFLKALAKKEDKVRFIASANGQIKVTID